MKRRDFSAGLAVGAGLAGTLLPGAGRSQGVGPVEGMDYVKLGRQLPVAAGKIEVVEFFWYGCPHCYAFEPALEAWVEALPKDVMFKRVPIAFRPEPFIAHQKIYYALEALGLVGPMHAKVFAAIHVDHKRMDKPDEIAAVIAQNGGNDKAFLDSYNSFGVTAKARQATQLQAEYKVDAVPCLGIQGRYLTSGVMAGTPERSLVVANFLVDKVRSGG